jgi:hypothetical protein
MRLSELRILYGVLDENRERIENALQSIKEGLITIDDFDNGDWFKDGNRFYGGDEYVQDYYGNVLQRDNAFYCNGEDDWFSDEDAVVVYEHRSETTYSRRWAEGNCDLNMYRGDYYDSDALAYHELVYVEDEGEIWREDDAYYHEDDGYYSYPPDERETYVREYHNGSYQSKNFDGKSKYRIGYEIEKEDEDVLESIDIDDFEEQTDYKWRKEKDSSLDSQSGYELISPTFEFDIDKIFEHIEGNDNLVRHINAKISPRCGGHIHLSEEGLNGHQLFDKLKGYTPLFYALYYGRVDKTYSKGKSNRDLERDNEKYQAIKIHHDRIEFRIISAVPNITTLKWRTKLLMMILQHPTDDIIRAYYNVDTKFTKLLKQTYSDEKLLVLKQRFVDFTIKFEGLDINDKKE